MVITSYYRGGTNCLTGLTFDTNRKVYRMWQLKAEDWMHRNVLNGWVKQDKFKIPGDINFYQHTQAEVFNAKNKLDELNFVEDQQLELKFSTM